MLRSFDRAILCDDDQGMDSRGSRKKVIADGAALSGFKVAVAFLKRQASRVARLNDPC
jgi:hypothetical protein